MSNIMILAAAAVIAVVVLRRIAPIVASVIAIALTLAVGIIGMVAYGEGGTMKLGNMTMSRGMFLGLVAVVISLESWNLWRRLKWNRRRREEAEREAREAAEQAEPEQPRS